MAEAPDARTPRARRTVGRIIEAARQVLEQEGPAAFNTNLVAARAGLAVGSLYRYFRDKEAVLEALRRQLSEEEAVAVLGLVEAMAGASTAELATAAVRLLADRYEATSPVYQAIDVYCPEARSGLGRLGSEQALLEALATRIGGRASRSRATMLFFSAESLARTLARSQPASRLRREILREYGRMVEAYLDN